MRMLILILSILIIAFVIFQSFIVSNTRKTEEQKYTLMEKEGDFEIRFYPKAVMATVTVNDASYDRIGTKGFRKLAGFIFGGNEKGESIAMTSPVHMQASENAGTMSFVMPSSYNKESLPLPNDTSIRIHETEEEHVAAVSYGGFSSDKENQKQINRLKEYLQRKNIKSVGEFRYLGYNPPYQVVNRKNDIIVRIEYPLKKP